VGYVVGLWFDFIVAQGEINNYDENQSSSEIINSRKPTAFFALFFGGSTDRFMFNKHSLIRI
jgi:hypothetical protein